MNPYSVEILNEEGHQMIRMRDASSDSIAEVVPEIGNNLYRFDIAGRRVLQPPACMESLKNEPCNYGTPVLFPPNRVKNGRFTFKGVTYQLPINEPPDNHLHGEICRLAWEVLETGASEEKGAFVTCRIRYSQYPEIMKYFPHLLSFTITHRLYQGVLHSSGFILNEGVEEAPFAFGLHPYFSIPFDDKDLFTLKLPADKEWPVSDLAFVLGEPTNTDFSRCLSEGVPLDTFRELGCALLSMKSGDSACRLENKNKGYSIVYRFDRMFPFLVLFRPDWSPSFSLEPYTCVTDAFNLPFDHETTGARGIAAGETLSFHNSLTIEVLPVKSS